MCCVVLCVCRLVLNASSEGAAVKAALLKLLFKRGMACSGTEPTRMPVSLETGMRVGSVPERLIDTTPALRGHWPFWRCLTVQDVEAQRNSIQYALM